jgi:hypothetical protein
MLGVDISNKKVLIRYTNLVNLIDFFTSGNLCLLDPNRWSDKNDVYFIKRYLDINSQGFGKAFALCFSEEFERHHFWQIFSPKEDGVAIEFDKDLLIKYAEEKGVMCKSVVYKPITDLRLDIALDVNFNSSTLPFVKRIQFKDEKEFRLFYATDQSTEIQKDYYSIPVPLDAVLKVRLSPTLNKNLEKSVKRMIKNLPEVAQFKRNTGVDLVITKSSLYDNPQFKSLAKLGN